MGDLPKAERNDFFESANLLSLRFDVFSESEPHEYYTNPLPFIRFVFIQLGTARFYADGREIMSGARGDLIYIPANLAYRSVWSGDMRTFVADLRMDDFATAELDYGDEIRRLFADRRGVLEEAIGKLGKGPADGQLYLWMERAAIVMHILCEIARAQREESALKSRIQQSVIYMNYNFEKDTPAEKLAEMCSFSVSQFRRLFKQYFGMSPVEYRNMLRVRKADELLSRNDISVSRAAEMVGIDDVKYFAKLYKKYTGGTPGRKKASRAAQAAREGGE